VVDEEEGDDVYDQPYQSTDSVYLMALDVNISFSFTVNTSSTRLALHSTDFQFLEFSLRAALESRFVVWNSSSVKPLPPLRRSVEHENEFIGSMLTTLMVRVPSTDFDFFSLKQALALSLRTDSLSGSLQRIISAALAYQATVSGSESASPLQTCRLTLLTVLPGTSKILSLLSSAPAPYPSLFVGVNLTALVPPVTEGKISDDDGATDPSSSEYWDSHAWFALTVSGFTLAALLLCYLCFLLLRCRVKRLSSHDSSLLPSATKTTNRQPRKGYAKVSVAQRGEGDSGHNGDPLGAEEEDDLRDLEMETGDSRGALRSQAERAKRVGSQILKGVKEGFKRKRRPRDVENGSGFVELDGVGDSEDEITLDLNEMIGAAHRHARGGGGESGTGEDETY
jgi:hypothetical protein